MRRLVLLVVLLSGCSLLVQFRDEPDPCADGGCVDASLDGASDVQDAGSDIADVRDVMPFDAAHICKGSYDGYYCGFNSGLNGKTPSPDDLVRCIDGGAIITYCDAGCIAYPTGIPDMCNSCGNKQGYYCNGQLGPENNVPYLSLCNGGQMIPQMKCMTKCVPGQGDASCQ